MAFPHSPQNVIARPNFAPQCGHVFSTALGAGFDARAAIGTALFAAKPKRLAVSSISPSTAASSFCSDSFVL
jgi:hypothetical protein